jgi:hypothetical protein
MDPQQWNVGDGDHTVNVDCKFSDMDNAALKLEIKTAGAPEKVSMK